MAETMKLETDSQAAELEGEDAGAKPAKPEGMNTWQKVGVGAGVVAGTGVAGWALYRIADHFGWFARRPSIIIDEDELEPDGGGEDGGSGGGSGGGGGSSRTSWDRAIGNPPNMTGHPKGYNFDLFPDPTPIRVALNKIGYNVAYTGGTLAPNGTPNSEVQRFQSDYNKVIRGIDRGKVKLPKSVPEPKKLDALRGILVADGIPGKNTLKGLEIAFANQEFNKLTWRDLVKAGRS